MVGWAWGCVCRGGGACVGVCVGGGTQHPGWSGGGGALRAGSTVILLSGSLILGCFSSLSFQFI